MQHDALFQTIQIAANQIKIDVQQIFTEISARSTHDQKLYSQRIKKYEEQLTQLILQLDSIESSEQSTRRKRKAHVNEIHDLLRLIDKIIPVLSHENSFEKTSELREENTKLQQENQDLRDANKILLEENKSLEEKLRQIENLVQTFGRSYRDIVQ